MDGELFPRERTLIAPGAVHVPDWLGPLRQRELLAACREWARPPAGLRTVSTPGGGTMTARQVCLGLHWYPYAYARTAVDGDGAPVKPMPGWLAELGRDAVAAAYAGTGDAGTGDAGVPAGPSEAYDIALINFYDGDARMGMHRDAEERSAAPVVSLSLGDACVFRFGNTASRGRPYRDVELRSGDLFVFGGPSRRAYHGVPRVLPGTAPPTLGLTGRLNVTLRVGGLGQPPAPATPDGH
ncbi:MULTISPECIES: alpha-ketoglutarate-dependent dioxygenase AlkB family protein [Streptomyces]|uniref:alpha-ketoglutarate-dependent dioxygenase AlkB family protein n=1 Tax=Streptomyces TaxID=1883 RepID=UPI00064D68B7|nr:MULTISPECIES: alpha-ketoglutarate-dependent dioxygenase AlkB [Streptomyces]AKL65077.1 DNA repair protein [Streptomyces sp. Mg1]RPK39370.1 Alpha-ketoglutarate-dependent dioxygenase AlkB [Streptomyces sp. ADI91-18]WBY19026.1 alpha-ketoglutarate-dependent dioxygenase AlkB [Streptomyces goshikiensis]